MTDMSVEKVSDLANHDELVKAVKPAIASKQHGNEDLLAKLVAEAVLSVMPSNPKVFSVDNVRVVKIMGGSLAASTVVKGMVINRETEGDTSYFHRNISIDVLLTCRRNY